MIIPPSNLFINIADINPSITRSPVISDQFDISAALSESKFRLICHIGIKEQPIGSLCHTRLVNDPITVHSISQDCTRLVKFSKETNRPIFVKISCSCHVLTILSQRSKLKNTGVFIKPEVSPKQLKIESILMKKRWEIVLSGITHDVIKIKGTSLYVHNSKVGTVVNFEFIDSGTVVFPKMTHLPYSG